jgi:hypothetical protein
VVDQVIVAVVAVTCVAATLKTGGAVAACPLPANAVIAEAKLKITMYRMTAQMHFELSIKAPVGDIYTNLFGLLRQSNCIEGLRVSKIDSLTKNDMRFPSQKQPAPHVHKLEEHVSPHL